MDPLTAVGLAGNVAQFVDFALGFISTVGEITSSARGASKKTLELESVYRRLQTFTTILSQTSQYTDGSGNTGLDWGHVVAGTSQHYARMGCHAKAIEAMAGECKSVCDRLLTLVDGLRLKPGQSGKAGRWVKATVLTIKSVFAEKKIAEMEQSLNRFQTVISLHYLPLLDAKLSYLSDVAHDNKANAFNTSSTYAAKLQEIISLLDGLRQNISPAPLTTISEPRGEKEIAVTVAHDSGDLEHMFLRLSLAEKDLNAITKEQVFVKSLYYRNRMDRYENIPKAHAATFEWLFDDALPRRGISNSNSGLLYQWLCSGSGTFWVTGKPGSGKSTFMKFAASHLKTRMALKRWAGPNNVIIAMHYFWNAGTTMQKSIKGLLQSLLYAVLECQPDLASVIFPTQWREMEQSGFVGDRHWTTEEMRAGLERLSKLSDISTNFCFFVDGLDEYDGKYTDEYDGLCQLFDEISLSKHLKCCVSSRPWNVFANAYAQNPASTLYIHEVTSKDIMIYTKSRLSTHTRWSTLNVLPNPSQDIVSTVTERAKGVFLWVFLVTTSLRNGLTDGDTIYDLRRRLESLPTEIEPFYKHMLDRVEPTNHRYMSRTLQFAYCVNAANLFTYYSREFDDINSNYALDQPPCPEMLLDEMAETFLEPCRRRINSRCGGLLGINQGRVEFIHRTARDFLATKSMKDYLREKADGEHYNSNMAILKAVAYLFRCFLATPALDGSERIVAREFQACLEYADKALEEDKEYGLLLLSTFTDTPGDRAIKDPTSVRETFLRQQARYQTQKRPISTTTLHGMPPEHGLVGPCVYHHLFGIGLDKFIIPQLIKDPLFFRNMPVSPMVVSMGRARQHTPYVKIRISLLKAGYDVNQPVGQSTPWNCFISEYLSLDTRWKASIINPIDGDSLMLCYLEMGALRVQRIRHQSEHDSPRVFDLPLFPLTHILLDLFLGDFGWKEAVESFATVVNAFLSGTHLETTMQLEELKSKLPCVLQGRSSNIIAVPVGRAYLSVRKAVMETIIRRANCIGVDMQSLVPDILAYFGHIEGESIASLISKSRRPDINNNIEHQLLHPKQEQILPSPVFLKAPKRVLQEQPGDTKRPPRRSKRLRGR